MVRAVGVIAAQSIGEPGTQLTLRTFHVGGIAGNISTQSTIESKYDGIAEIEELRVVEQVNADATSPSGKTYIVVSRLAELRIIDKNTRIQLSTHNIPYGSKLYIENGQEVKKGMLICEWDPYNGVIITEFKGKIAFEQVIDGVTYREESDRANRLQGKSNH